MCIYMNTNIKNYIKSLGIESKDIKESQKDEEELLNTFLKTEIVADGIKKETIIEHINVCFNKDVDKGIRNDIQKMFNRNGFKVSKTNDDFVIILNTADNNFKKLLKGTKFEHGDVTSMFCRLLGSVLIKDSMMIGGIRTSRSKVVELHLNTKDYTI